MDRPSVRVCLTPDLLQNIPGKENEIVVVVDILRATTSICTALANGAVAIIPVTGGKEKLERTVAGCQLPKARVLLAGESDGIKLPYADLGNSPLEFTKEAVTGKTIIFSTTNGTRAICQSAEYGDVIIGSFVNFSALLKYLITENKDTMIVCSGWKGQFSLEDTLYAGKLAERLTAEHGFIAGDDPVSASICLWKSAEGNMLEFAKKSSHYQRLILLESEEGLHFCFEPPEREVLPKLAEDRVVDWLTVY